MSALILHELVRIAKNQFQAAHVSRRSKQTSTTPIALAQHRQLNANASPSCSLSTDSLTNNRHAAFSNLVLCAARIICSNASATIGLLCK